MSPAGAALIVVSDLASRRALARALGGAFTVHAAEDRESAASVLGAHTIDVAVADPGLLGDLVAHPALVAACTAVVALAPSPIEAVRALEQGALCAIPLPIDAPWALAAARRAAAVAGAARQARAQHQELRGLLAAEELITASAAMRSLERALRRAASTSGSVLILGEPGSGVSLVARRLHALGPSAERRVVEIAASAYAESDGRDLVAALEEPGRSVVLDGVETLGRAAQDALAALLEARARAGARPGPRLVATARPDVRERAERGTFRRDLLHGLASVLLEVPPLRQRADDVPQLAQMLLGRAARLLGRPEVRRIGTEAIRALRKEPWPGNVRELGAVLERAVLEAPGDVVLPSHLPGSQGARSQEARRELAELSGIAPTELLDLPHAPAKERAVAAFDRAYAEALLRRNGGNTTQAARAAGMDRSNFKRLLRRSRKTAAAPAAVRSRGVDAESK